MLYDADKVPVGEDQKQHLELTRDIAGRINDKFGRTSDPASSHGARERARKKQPVLKVPEPLIRKEGARVMSLTDGTKKMSKSDPSELSRIELLDSPEAIKRKIKKCKTDPVKGLTFDNRERPECDNLLTLYQILGSKTKEEVATECQDMGWGQFKPLLTETAIAALQPIQNRYHELMDNRDYLDSVLRDGSNKASSVANQTLTRVKDALGFLPPL